MSPRPDRPESADISFTAKLSAETLRFDDAPETRVEFTGSPAHESASGSDRVNVPEPVQAAVTYRNVQVDYRLAAKLSYEDEADPATNGHRADARTGLIMPRGDMR